jgi:hypothetical protein
MSINQYWRDFKMLFRDMNDGCPVNGADASEVVKVPSPSSIGLLRHVNCRVKVYQHRLEG